VQFLDDKAVNLLIIVIVITIIIDPAKNKPPIDNELFLYIKN